MNTITASTITTINAATAPGSGGQDVFSFIDSLTSDATSTIGGILVLAGIIVALIISIGKRTFGGVIVGVAVGGLIAGLGALVVAISGVFTQTADSSPTAAEQPAIVQQAERGTELL